MDEFIFFWGHHAKQPGVVGPHVFSQWWPASFTVDGVTYPTAEHWMMCAKARFCNDEEKVQEILADRDPARAKWLGRHIANWDEVAWVGVRLDVVTQGSFHKFDQNPALGDYLISTGTKTLVEASPHDRIWGVGMKGDDPRITDPKQWNGLNLLGMALMLARADLILQRKLDVAEALADAKGG
jgi:ribA/ribD-fused uncharacterized protein